jgi:hypothetical protein
VFTLLRLAGALHCIRHGKPDEQLVEHVQERMHVPHAFIQDTLQVPSFGGMFSYLNGDRSVERHEVVAPDQERAYLTVLNVHGYVEGVPRPVRFGVRMCVLVLLLVLY